MPSRSRVIRSLSALVVVLATIAVLPTSAVAARPAKLPWEGPPVRVKPGSIVVVFASGTTAAQKREIHGDVGARVADRGRTPAIDVVDLAPSVSPLAAIRRYQADPRVLSAELDRFAAPTLIPDDNHFAKQWALRNRGQFHPISGDPRQVQGRADADVDAETAWNKENPGGEVVVAVLDSGVDVDHPDLADSMWLNPGEPGVPNGVDDDGNGYIDDLNGWDFRGNDNDPSPPGGNLNASHGTHVAGIIAAERGNGMGIAGVCGRCRIMALRSDLSLGQEIEAIEYAVANGADVINMSFAGKVWSPAERAAIQAAGAARVLTVAAAGNFSADNDIPFYPSEGFAPAFPASYNLPTILSVAASNDRDQYALDTRCDRLTTTPRWRCAFTSWGHDSVDVAAPGVDIVSTVHTSVGSYKFFDGTSMSAPLVAGIAGAVLHEHPGYRPVDLKNAVMNSVNRPASLTMLTSWADATGVPKTPIRGKFTRTQGRVNANGALTAPTTNATPLTDGNINGARFLATSARNAVAWPSDVNDVYRKRLLGGNRRYRITLNGPPGKDMDLWVWSPGAKEIHQFTAGCFGTGPCPAVKAVSATLDADERVTFRVANTGTFFIHVQGWYSGGRYSLSVRRV